MKRARTWGWAKTPRYDSTSSDLGPSSPHQSCSGCIIATRGYDFREGQAYIQRIVAHHVTPREAGRVFAQAKPKLAVYTHLVMLASEHVPPPTLDDILAETRESYVGPLEVGEDLMSFEIGETVFVNRFNGR
jgi:hypothetical protein